MKELADRIVALGVLYQMKPGHELYWLAENKCVGGASEAEKSWEVAGALMEKCLRIVAHKMSDGWTVTAINDADEGNTVFNKSFPHAIILACVEALEGVPQ